jgi:hypothetical protein
MSKSTEQVLISMVIDEHQSIFKEPPIEDLYLEIALWRAMYKIATEVPSLRASAMQAKSAAIKKARIKIAREHIDWAILDCKSKNLKPIKTNIENALLLLKSPHVFSDEKELAKTAIVRSNTIKDYLLEMKMSGK